MRITKKLITRFDRPDTLVVISKYPYKNIAHSFHGVATYTDHSLNTFIKCTNRRVILLVEREYHRGVEIHENGKLLVIPAFSAHPFHFLQIVRTLNQFPSCKLVHLHSEYITSGNMLLMAAVPVLHSLLRLSGRRVIYYAHNVVQDFSFIARHLGQTKTSLAYRLLERVIPWYYWSIGITANLVVALDLSIQQRLGKVVSKKKVYLSPHWIFPQTLTSSKRQYWRRKLGMQKNDFVITCFGFMTRYKGVDWLAQTIAQLQQDPEFPQIKLILAGGKAPSQQGKKHYEAFYRELKRTTARSTQVQLTGFIPEKELAGYFSATDLVILPYRGILGASGAWSQALAYGKPFLLSSDLAPYLESPDIQSILSQSKLSANLLVCRRNRNSLANHLVAISDPQTLRAMAKISKQLGVERSAENQLNKELPILFENTQAGKVLYEPIRGQAVEAVLE